jgi:peptide/nickel transport system substrate-binding protein
MMIATIFRRLAACGITLFLVSQFVSHASATTLTIGMSTEVTSMDPQFQLIAANKNIADHIFDRLVHRNAALVIVPGLAKSWRLIDNNTWEFSLQPGVKFHDGSAFTAEDVKFSIERIPTIKDSPNPFTTYTKAISAIEVVDRLTVRIKTATPNPLIPNDLSVIPIVSKSAAQGAPSADFNSGKAVIGTGPYKFAKFIRGDRVELVRNDKYWDRPPAWEQVVFRHMPNYANRLAALQNGEVQAIEGVSANDMAKIRKDPNLRISVRYGYRLIHLAFNPSDEMKIWFSDKSGKPLSNNPMRNLQVRQALNKAISRDALLGRVLGGAATLTGQLMNSGLPGFVADIGVPTQNIDAARKLLAQAGYPSGFRMTIHGPSNRWHMDTEILNTLARMFGEIGVDTTVESMPASAFFSRRNKGEFAVYLGGWSPDSFEGSSMLRPLIATRNLDKGLGEYNFGYSNTEADALMDKMMLTMQNSERENLMAAATRLVMNDVALIPLHHQVIIWATRREVAYPGRADERTYAFEFTPVPLSEQKK